jgi:glycerol kinase
MLPEIKSSSDYLGYSASEVLDAQIPISGCAGDQQAALFGHRAIHQGDSKCTYGTGNFLLMNTGNKPVWLENLLTTIAWNIGGETKYALEGSIFITGAAIQWLRDELKIITLMSETEDLAKSITENDGVYMVPAFTGLGAPHWNQSARGIITGLTRGTTRAHIIRAALESIAYQTYDLIDYIHRNSGNKINVLRVDGGATRNKFLMQFQSDLLNIPILRPSMIEGAALGAAYLAGMGIGLWENFDDLPDVGKYELFTPKMDYETRNRLITGWRKALEKTLSS